MIKFEYNSMVKERPVYFCLSGGVDSVALSHWLATVFRLDFEFIHVQHGQAQIQREMRELARDHASNLGRTIHIHEYSKPLPASNRENFWRELRLDAFSQYRDSVFIFAHHLDDAVTGYLMNCYWGTPERSPLPTITHQKEQNNYFLRPFVKDTLKSDCISYAIDNDLQWIEDPYNYNNDCLRVRMDTVAYKLGISHLRTVVRKRLP